MQLDCNEYNNLVDLSERINNLIIKIENDILILNAAAEQLSKMITGDD